MVAEIHPLKPIICFSHIFHGINISKHLSIIFMIVLFSKWTLHVGLNVISIFKCKHHYRSCDLREIMNKMINENKIFLHLGKFCMFHEHVMYSPCI